VPTCLLIRHGRTASNADGTVGPDNYNVIKTDGTTPAWYDNFKAASLNDANR